MIFSRGCRQMLIARGYKRVGRSLWCGGGGTPYHLRYRVNIDAYTHVYRLPKLALKLSMPMGARGKRKRTKGVVVGSCGGGKILSRSLGGGGRMNKEIKCGLLAIDRVVEPIIIKSQYAVGVISVLCVCVCKERLYLIIRHFVSP